MQLDNLNLESILFRDCSWHLCLLNHSGILSGIYAEKVVELTNKICIFTCEEIFTWKYICSYGVWATEFYFVKSVIFNIRSNYNQKLQERLLVYFNKSGASKGFQRCFYGSSIQKQPPSLSCFPNMAVPH